MKDSGTMTAPEIPAQAAPSSHPVIRLVDVHKTYHTGEVDVRAVQGVTLDIQKGEFVAIMGASGSGKSTMMNIIGCLDRTTSGTYQLDGVDVADLDRDELADIRNEKIGFVFQGFNLLARTTALENVELPMLEMVGLGDRLDHTPNQLSGGQQQRVAIARALVADPALILADEPTGNLDSRTSIEIMGVFQKLNEQGITIVMVTHELDIARFTRRNVVMRDGRVVTDKRVENRLFAEGEMDKLRVEAEAIQMIPA
jgi:putative ABC transport system ATP-binding protein